MSWFLPAASWRPPSCRITRIPLNQANPDSATKLSGCMRLLQFNNPGTPSFNLILLCRMLLQCSLHQPQSRSCVRDCICRAPRHIVRKALSRRIASSRRVTTHAFFASRMQNATAPSATSIRSQEVDSSALIPCRLFCPFSKLTAYTAETCGSLRSTGPASFAPRRLGEVWL